MALNSKLPAFLGTKAQDDFVWGRNDCGLWLADWVVVAMGVPDPALHLRRAYRTEVECAERFGKIAVLREVRRICAGLDLAVTTDPMSGDIGVVAVWDVYGRRAIVGAICVKRGWMTLAPRGLSCVPHDQIRILRAWRVEEQCRKSSH